jgi:hypothetical protein
MITIILLLIVIVIVIYYSSPQRKENYRGGRGRRGPLPDYCDEANRPSYTQCKACLDRNIYNSRDNTGAWVHNIFLDKHVCDLSCINCDSHKRRPNPHNLWYDRTFPNVHYPTKHNSTNCSKIGQCATVYDSNPSVPSSDTCNSHKSASYYSCKVCLDDNQKNVTDQKDGKVKANILANPSVCDNSCIKCDITSRRPNPHNLWYDRTFPNKDITLHVPKDCSNNGICGTVYKPGIGVVDSKGNIIK